MAATAQTRRGVVFAGASIACFLVSSAFALFLFARQGWFGAGDLRAFFFYSFVLALLLGVLSAGLTPVLWKRSLGVAYVGSGLLGIGAGFGFTVGILLLFGQAFGAWSIPVLQCWLAGGVAGGIVAALSSERHQGQRALMGIGSLLVALALLWLGYSPLLSAVRHDQHLTVTFGRLVSTSSTMVVEDPRGLTSNDEKELLRQADFSGKVVIEGASASNTTQSPLARVLVVADGPIQSRVRLRQPDGTTVAYIQTAEGFRMIPANARTLDRGIELWPSEGNPKITMFSVEMAGGGGRSSGGTAFVWD